MYKFIVSVFVIKETHISVSVYKKPEKRTSEKNFEKQLADWLFTGCWSTETEKSPKNKCNTRYHSAKEYPGYDGWYNNVGKPDLGAVDTPLLRKWPAAYEDGVYKPSGSNRPNPLVLSDRLLSGEIGSKSRTGKNALLVFFGM